MRKGASENGAEDPLSQQRRRRVPDAPRYTDLPVPSKRVERRGSELREMNVRLEVVTPILGGSTETRAVDEVDIIRAPSVRGHLRFWWRALYAAQHSHASALSARESEIWGCAATPEGRRSGVEIRIDVEKTGAIDNSDIDLQQTPGAYALWPARSEKKQGTPPAPRRLPGTQFRIILATAATFEPEVRNALRAWILFGGYGGRTRRGLGSLRILADSTAWLPTRPTPDAIAHVFGWDVFAAPAAAPGDVPWLAGAALHVGKVESDPMKAWTTALDWLREFRQGTRGPQGERAREPGTGKPMPQRPSISNWPEPDKIRHLAHKIRAHKPRHNATPAWPRAGFGLPILGRFQTQARGVGHYDEPQPYELRWRSPRKDRPGEFDEHDRLASPLIVKALPLADGTFVPCALWLNRGYPSNAEVGLARPKRGGRPSEREIDPATVAPFDLLVAPGDRPQFSVLASKQSLRQAFLDWLQARYKTTVVAP